MFPKYVVKPTGEVIPFDLYSVVLKGLYVQNRIEYLESERAHMLEIFWRIENSTDKYGEEGKAHARRARLNYAKS